MEKIDQLADVILTYARGKEPRDKPMPRVSFHFEHDGSDLPELPDAWMLTVTLRGVDHLEGDKPVLSFEEKWEGKGSTAGEAFAAFFKQFRSSIYSRQLDLESETTALRSALSTLKNPDLKTLWPNKDPEEQAVADFKALTEETGRGPT